jgi:GMP synthase (glutamine-hydrolysing)
MPRLLVFQHVAHEILGTLHPQLKDAGFRIRYVNFARHQEIPDISRYDGLVVLGGPMGVYEADKFPHIGAEITCIKKALDQDKPVLGICLGSQLLAAALGSRVYKHHKKEIGWYDVTLTDAGKADPIFFDMRPTEKIFQWHGDTFELPNGAAWLAHSDACEQQAFRYGDKAYGLQFHLEVDEPMINRWLMIPANVEEMAPLGGDTLAARIRADTQVYLKRQTLLSSRVFASLIEIFS